jgi:type IV pilus assembly protein PilC
MQLKIYKWQGINNDGVKVAGELGALSPDAVKLQLAQQSIFPTAIRKKAISLFARKKIKSKQLADFSRQLAVLLNAGIQLLPALRIIEASCNHQAFNQIIIILENDLLEGVAFSVALRKHGKYFNELFCSLAQIGEESGKLDLILTYIADHQENVERLKRKVAKALFYPFTVLLIAAAVTMILLIFVVPQFATMFYNFGAALPAYTQFIIKLAAFLQHNIWLILLVVGCAVIGFRCSLKHSLRFSCSMDKLKLHLPIIGQVLKQAMLNIFCRTLGITMTAGLPLAKTLPVIAKTINNQIFQRSILNLEEQLKAGNSLVTALKMNPLFPQRMIQIIAVGEEAGTLAAMLVKAADYYEAEVNHVVENLSNLLEPLIMVVLGVLVGGVIIGMYLPIFKIGTAI